jgi:phage gpG-like protein
VKIDLRFERDTIDRLKAVLEDREQAARVVTAALDEIADDFLNVQSRRFGAAGTTWVPLKPETALRKAAGGRHPLPLVGGGLEASLTRRGARFAVRRVEDNSVTLGTSDPVANLHQSGTRRMPRRPPVSLSRADERRWVEIIERHLSGTRTRVGL